MRDEDLGAELAGEPPEPPDRPDARDRIDIAYLPLDDPLAEAQRTRVDPWAGAVAGTGRPLDDPELEPLWAALDGRFVLVHPVEAPDPRLARFYLSNLLGNPYETALAAACLVFGGVLSRYPGVQFCLVHAGGATAMIARRWQQGYDTRRPGISKLELEPRDALRRLYVDSLAHSAAALALAASVFGDDHVLPGSDWPFPMGEELEG